MKIKTQEEIKIQERIDFISKQLQERDRLEQQRKNEERVWLEYESAKLNKRALERNIWRTLSAKKRHLMKIRLKTLNHTIHKLEHERITKPLERTYSQQQNWAAEGSQFRAEKFRNIKLKEEKKRLSSQIERLFYDIEMKGMDSGEALFIAEQRVMPNQQKFLEHIKEFNPKIHEKLVASKNQFLLKKHYAGELEISLKRKTGINRGVIEFFQQNPKLKKELPLEVTRELITATNEYYQKLMNGNRELKNDAIRFFIDNPKLEKQLTSHGKERLKSGIEKVKAYDYQDKKEQIRTLTTRQQANRKNIEKRQQTQNKMRQGQEYEI